MKDTIPWLRTTKGKEFKIYKGTGQTPDLLIQFKENGVALDISSWGDLKVTIKEEGKPDDDAAISAEAITVVTASEGKIRIPFQTKVTPIVVAKKGKGLIMTIYEVDGTSSQKVIRKEYRCNIYEPQVT